MDEHSKEYLLDQAMISVASFAAAGRMAKAALDKGGAAHNGMSSEDVLKYLIEFMEEESEKMFKNYDETTDLKKKVSRSTTYIDLIPEAPFNPEDKKSTIDILRDQNKDDLFHLVYVVDEKGNPKFITINEFDKNYYHYWECLMKHQKASPEDIEKFKEGKSDYLLHGK